MHQVHRVFILILQHLILYDKSIVFTSDRNGSPHIYTMNKNGGNLSRISLGYSTYSDPTWSPQGKLISCIKLMKNDSAEHGLILILSRNKLLLKHL